MLLIPEQVSYLREEIRRRKENIANYQSYFCDRKVEHCDNSVRSIVGDTITDVQFQMNNKKLTEYKNLLATSEYVMKPLTDKIGIGTKFRIQFDGEDEIEEYVLVDTLIGTNMVGKSISAQTPIGKNIIGKKEGDTFSYIVGQGPNSRQITGTIVEIKKERNSYISFIRSKSIYDRRCLSVKNELHQLNATQEKKKLYLTSSQKELLEEEVDRLLKIDRQGKNEKSSIRIRLTNIKKTLEISEEKNPPTDDTIGIGTTFSILIFYKDKTVNKRLEMIDTAVGDELNSEYIERISPLGNTLIGLKNNDEFIVQDANFNYISGIVYDIDNRKNKIQTNSALIYKRKEGRIGKF